MDRHTRAHRCLLMAAAAGVLMFAACGGGGAGGDGGGGGGETAEVELTTVDNDFEPKTLSVPAGAEVTVTVTNDGQAPHTFTSEELGVDTGNLDPGASEKATFTAPDSGETEFVCTIHEAAGMVGTITVE